MKNETNNTPAGLKPSKASPDLSRPVPCPAIHFSPTAWAKLLYLRDMGDTEVGGFGIASADDLLLVEDVRLIRQVCTSASVAFDDQAVADFFDEQVDRGLRPERFARLWIHTHPGNGPEPSHTDEQTFGRVFGRTDWAVMFILARGGRSFARLRFHVGPGGDIAIPVSVDYSRPFSASDHEAWKQEYLGNVLPEIELGLIEPILTRRSLFNEPLEPFGADAEGLDRWPDLFDAPFDEEFGHGNYR